MIQGIFRQETDYSNKAVWLRGMVGVKFKGSQFDPFGPCLTQHCSNNFTQGFIGYWINADNKCFFVYRFNFITSADITVQTEQ